MGRQTFSIKSSVVNTYSFAGHMVSVVTTQLYYCNTICKQISMAVFSYTLFMKKQVEGKIWPMDYNFLISANPPDISSRRIDAV